MELPSELSALLAEIPNLPAALAAYPDLSAVLAEYASILADLENTEVGRTLAENRRGTDALRHLWAIRHPSIPFGRTVLYNWLATLGYTRTEANRLSLAEVCKLLQGVIPPAANPSEGEGNSGAGSAPGKRATAKRGRRCDTDPQADKRIATAWATRRYRKYEDLGREFKMNGYQVKAALDRYRHRVK